jgi:UDP-glucose 4-epimerase
MINVLITGGAGFVGSNLVKTLKELYDNIDITVLDNYFTGKEENHIPDVKYIKGNTWDADKIFANRQFHVVYHFGEYSRIVKSFDDIDYVQRSILSGTPVILNLCKQWNAKLIYSASSSKFGNDGKDENLSPYAWAKSKMVELIKNYGKWFGLRYEICYFFNVYGPGQITEGDYSTVIGIFERQFKNNEPLTVVEPGTQSRDFTHINDIVSGLIKVFNKELCHEWHLRSGENVTILEVAKMFGGTFKMVPSRRGERFTSEEFQSDTEILLEWKPTHSLKNWIDNIKSSILTNH